ncbi:hypothetical protein BDQ12DRAFT_718243 [Crucibulum laeve]|uniref:Uncharacterized protein n=1 Tax=Crucibulum laeve TaxID=68775 RepID=A0A5C3MKB7_9AGAR|nr:hypothetical protein BDQ12DRAFT_718243 [Crucibulum laeve]
MLLSPTSPSLTSTLLVHMTVLGFHLKVCKDNHKKAPKPDRKTFEKSTQPACTQKQTETGTTPSNSEIVFEPNRYAALAKDSHVDEAANISEALTEAAFIASSLRCLSVSESFKPDLVNFTVPPNSPVSAKPSFGSIPFPVVSSRPN